VAGWSTQAIPGVVQAGIERAMKQVSHFAAKWSEATVENVLERYGVDDVGTIFQDLVESRAVYVPGIAADDMVERLQRAWDIEPSYSKTAIVNAVTRAARPEPERVDLPGFCGHRVNDQIDFSSSIGLRQSKYECPRVVL
jgi:hypothetical protein